MMLHCASRLGLLSYVYENRSAILFRSGLIEEIPIAVCSHAYSFHKGLKISAADDVNLHGSSLVQAQEIDHFLVVSFLALEPNRFVKSDNLGTFYYNRLYLAPRLTIFHPPLS
jgi:hypothetical protein